MFIQATGNISPQKTFGHPPFLTNPVEYTGNRLTCIEPEYKNFIEVKLIRRMSRIIRMGVGAAIDCLQEAGVKVPDAIITGTAYGCMEDTGGFLTRMVEANEELLSPTAFIQSTHNTIGSQIGLMLQSNNYNNVFVQRGFSFESALLDGLMLLKENEVENALIGGVDEITNASHAILTRLGLYKRERITNLEIFKSKTQGTMAGEGATFFLLANKSSATDYAKLDGLHTFYKPAGINEIEKHILKFLDTHSIFVNDIDLVVTGKNGDIKSDEVLQQLKQTIFKKNDTIGFKHLCGEYPTAGAFGLWTAANIIKLGEIPQTLGHKAANQKKIRRILIYNHYQEMHHSLILLSAC